MADEPIDPHAVLIALDLPPARLTTRMPGFDAVVWRVDLDDDRTLAVRLLRPGVPAGPEVAALRLAAEHGQPAPAVVMTGSCAGRDVVVQSWCRGRTIGELLLGGEGDPASLGRIFGRAQAELHRPLDRSGTVLCHLDFQPFNVLVDGDAVSGIVDWTNARPGDRREDIAWTRVVLAFAPALLPDVADGVAGFEAAWQAGYSEHRPMPEDAELAPFLAAAAARQVANWAPRVAAGEVPPAVLDAAVSITATWPG